LQLLAEELAAENGTLRARVERIETDLAAENEALRDRIAQLEAELGRNSENSSKPLSDPMHPASRAPSGARRRALPGGAMEKQPGAPRPLGPALARRKGAVLSSVLRSCGPTSSAQKFGEVCAPGARDPAIEVSVTDHVAERRRCVCGKETVGVFPSEGPGAGVLGAEVRGPRGYLMDRPAPAPRAHRRAARGLSGRRCRRVAVLGPSPRRPESSPRSWPR